MPATAPNLTVHSFNVGPLDNNTYVVVNERSAEAVVIDPSFESEPLIEVIQTHGWRIVEIVNTHGHIDHVAENALFMESFGVGLAFPPSDLPFLEDLEGQAAWMGIPTPRASQPTRMLAEGDLIQIGDGGLRVIHTPGHSPGSMTLLGDGFAIVGDVLFNGSVGRADLPGGHMQTLLTSIHSKLLTLPDDTIVHPGHGPHTTIGHEKRTNPFL